MTAQKGKDLLLKVDTDGAGSFVTVAGLRAHTLAFNAATVDVTDTESVGRWRELLDGARVKTARITGSGIFKDAINRGDGFQPATSGTNANAGDLLMANAGGSARLIYPGGCQVSIIPGRVVSVGKQPPCTAQSLVGEDYREGFFSNPVPPAIVGAAIGWGIFCAAKYCREDNPGGANGQGGRLGVGGPASP